MSLLPITNRQKEILRLLYRHRFLTRIQIQALFGHKDKKRTARWLKDLRQKGYIDWHYDRIDFINKSKLAIYYLAINGVRFIRLDDCYPDAEIRKRYRESKRSQAFMDSSLLVTDCCISLQSGSSSRVRYSYILPPDYVGLCNELNFLNELRPMLYLSKVSDDENTNYVLEIFSMRLPRYQLRTRLKEYVSFLQDWGGVEEDRPVALFACETKADLIYIKRKVKNLIEGDYIQVRITTQDRIKSEGVVSAIWENV